MTGAAGGTGRSGATSGGPAGPPVLVCDTCDGLTFTVDPCRCTRGGDRVLVDDDDRRAGTAYQDCQVCQGLGTVVRPCDRCARTGWRRAQLVLTVANIDTGAVASVNVVPGVLEPARWPDPDAAGAAGRAGGVAGGSWYLPVAPLLAELAAAVGAASWTELRDPPSGSEEPLLLLPRWHPDLPAVVRAEQEAEAILSACYEPWRIFLGRAAAAAPPEDPARRLGRLCRLADLLRLDLVLEARRRHPAAALSWHLRFEVSGGPVPDDARGHADELRAAVTGTTILDACYDLQARGRTAPGHYLTSVTNQPLPAQPRPPGAPVPPAAAVPSGAPVPSAAPVPSGAPVPAGVDLDEIERRMFADCVDLRTGEPTVGAQAIWRDGRWWHTSLRTAGTVETLTEWETGQIQRRARGTLRRGWQPPTPSWQGPPIAYADCPDCNPDNRLQRCDCRLFTGRVDPDCPQCSGAGRSPSALPCHTCRGSRRIHHGLTITVTDLADRAVHLTWRAGQPVPAPHVATHPGGKTLHQLPEQYRLATWAARFGVRPEDLTELDGGGDLGQSLCDGLVTLPHPQADPLGEHLHRIGAGQPGGRLLVLARRPDVPPVADLVRLVLGLRLAVTITVTDHVDNAGDPRRVQGESWDVTTGPAAAPAAPADIPTRSTPEAATAFCLRYLELATQHAVPADPTQPIPVPQTPTPIVVDDPVPLLRRLARHHPGQPVAVHYTGPTCQLWLRDRDGVRQLATAPTLPAAIGALGL